MRGFRGSFLKVLFCRVNLVLVIEIWEILGDSFSIWDNGDFWKD